MAYTIGIVGDPLAGYKPHKDTTLRLMLEAQQRGWALRYMLPADLSIRDGVASGRMHALRVMDDPDSWYEIGEYETRPLNELDLLLMRKDPPFDIEYVTATHILEQTQRSGLRVVNDPRGLRDIGEKLSIAQFPQFTPPTLITRRIDDLRSFLKEHEQIVVKPLDGMGGASIFSVNAGDANASVIFETLTALESRHTMAQRYIPEISAGDKRILVINGEPWPLALARIPAKGELRGNLAAGGRGEGVPLSERDREIVAEIGPWLRERGMLFCGLDVIGDYLTEINVTSPTCVRELEAIGGDNIAGPILDAACGSGE